MEEDERKKKLRAGKEKLAAFRKKKTKRKPKSDAAEGQDDEAVSPTRSDSSLDSSAEYTSSSDISYASCEDPESDGMSGDEISGQVDIREITKTRTMLRRAEDRISELKESLMGKQLALDKVIQENSQLKSKSDIKKLEELEAAILNRDDIIKHLTEQLQLGVPTESQQQYRMEAENLAKQVQLIQSQIQKEGQRLQSQTDQQNISSQALQDARNQILSLQDAITEKNAIINQLSQNLNKFTEEFSALKNMYETVKKKESETNQVVQQLMADAEVMRKPEKQIESVAKSSDDVDETERKLQALRSELEEMYGLQIAEMKQQVIQQYNMEKESLLKEQDKLLAEVTKVKDDYQSVVQQSEEYLREKDNLSDELDKMSEDYEKETNRVRELQHKLLEFEGTVNQTSDLLQECQLLRIQNDELKNKINSQQDSVVGLTAELELLANENARFKDQMACLTQELDKQCNENAVAVHEKTKLSEQLHSLDNELTIARQENKLHLDKVESMKDVIHSLRSELESAEKEKEELAQKCEDICKREQNECRKKDLEIKDMKHQLEKKLDGSAVNSDTTDNSQVWEDSDTLTESKVDSCHRNSVDLLTSQEQQVLDIIDKVLDVDENVCETESIAHSRDPHVLTTENIFIETDCIVPEIDDLVCETNQMFSETDNKLSDLDNIVCDTNTLNSETDSKLLDSAEIEKPMDEIVCVTLETDKFSQPKPSLNSDLVEPLAEISEIHFQSQSIHSDSFDDKDSGVISESLTFNLDGESLMARESELQPIGTEHFQSRLEQVTKENESFKLDIKMLNEQIEVMNTELELLKEDRQRLQVELDAVKHEKSISTHGHSEDHEYTHHTTNEDGQVQNQNVYGEKTTSSETEFIDEKLENLLEENEDFRKKLADVSVELEKVQSEDVNELENSELEDKVHQMELKINSYIAGEASLLKENEQLRESNSELQLQVEELQVRVKDLTLLKFEMDETVEVKERDFQKMVEEQMVEHEEFDFEKEELLKRNREMRKELDQLSVCEQNTRDECELLEEKCKILETEIKEYEAKTADLDTENQKLILKVQDLEKMLETVKLEEECHSMCEQNARDECQLLKERCKVLDTEIKEYEAKTADLEAQNQILTLKVRDLEKLDTVKFEEDSCSTSGEVNMTDSSNEDLLNTKEDLLNKIVDLEAKVESLSLENGELQEKEVALAVAIEEKSKSDEKMLELQERTREKIEELTNTINEKEERLRQTENRYDTEIQVLKTENMNLVQSLEDDLKNATEREEMLQANSEKFRFEMQTLVDKNEYLSKLVSELQTSSMTLTKDNGDTELEEKVTAEMVLVCENVYGTTLSPQDVTSHDTVDSYKPEFAEVQKKSARKSLMKQFSKDSLEERESSAEKEVPTAESHDLVEEESEDVDMVRNNYCMLASDDGLNIAMHSVNCDVDKVNLSTKNIVDNVLLSAKNSSSHQPNIMQSLNSDSIDELDLDLVLKDENYFDSLISNLQIENSVLLEKIKLMQKSDESGRIRLSDLEKKLTENCHYLSCLKLFCAKLAKECCLFKSKLLEKDSVIAYMTSDFASLQSSSQVMKSENTNLETKVHLQSEELEKLQVEISSLLTNKEALVKELAELHDQCLYLNLQIGQSQDKAESETLQREKCDLRVKVMELEEKVSELEKTGEDKQNMIDKLTNENGDVMATLTQKDEIITEKMKEFEMVSMEIKYIKDENEHLKVENIEYKSILDEKSMIEDERQRDIEKLKSLNDDLIRKNVALTEECDSCKAELVTQSDELNSFMCSQEKLEKQNTEIMEKMKNLQTCFEKLEKENFELNSVLVQLRTEFIEKENLLKEKEESFESVLKENKQNLNLMEENQVKISQLETDMNDVVTKLTEREAELNIKSEKLKLFGEEKEQLETEITSKLAEILKLKGKIEKYDQDCEKLVKEKESLEDQIVEIRNKHDQEQQLGESIKIQNDKLQNEKKELQVKVEELEEKLKQEKEEFEEKLKQEKEEFEEKLKQEKEDFEEKLKQEKDNYEEKLKQEKEDFDEKLKKQKESFEANFKIHEDNFEEKLKQEKEIFEEKLKQEKEIFEEKLKQQEEDFEDKIKKDKKDYDEQREIYDVKMIEIVTNGQSIKESCALMMEKIKQERDEKEEALRLLTESSDMLKQEYENLKSSVQEFKEEMESSKNKIRRLEEDLETSEKKVKDLQERIAFTERLEVYEAESCTNDDLLEELNSLKSNCEKLRNEVNVHVNERDVLKDENTEFQNKIQELEKENELLGKYRDNIELLQQRIQELEEENKLFGENKDKLELFEQKIQGLEVENELLRKNKDELESMQNRIQILEEENELLEKNRDEFKSMQNKIQELEKENELLEKNKDELESMQNKIQELKEENELLEKNKDELESMQNRIQQVEEENELLRENRDELESELGRAAESLQTAVKRRGNSNTEMEDLRKELHALTDIRNELMAQVESLGSNLKDSQKLSEELSQELKKAAVDKDKEISKNRQLVMEKKALKLKLEKLDICNGKLQTTVDNLERKNSELLKTKTENSELTQKFTILNEKIVELDEEVQIERKEKMKYITIAEQYGNIEDELEMERNEKMKYLKSAEELGLQHDEMLNKCKELEKTVELEQNKRKDLERQYQVLVEEIEALKLKRDDLLETKEDMADCLQDLQSKYEDVRSLMEGTQKDYEKEIGDLQTQLSNVGENFKCLTSVVDSLENDLKEKNKENKELMSSLQQERELRESLLVEQENQNTMTDKNQKDHKNRTMMGVSQNEKGLQELEVEVQTEIDLTTMEGLIQNAGNDSGFLLVEENLQCQEVHILEGSLHQICQNDTILSGNGFNIERMPKTPENKTDQLGTNANLSSELENAVCSSYNAGDFVRTDTSLPAYQTETMQEEQISSPKYGSEMPGFCSETLEGKQISTPKFGSEMPGFCSDTVEGEQIFTPKFGSKMPGFCSETVEGDQISVPLFRSETAEHISMPAFRSETAELEQHILPSSGQIHEHSPEKQVPIQTNQSHEITHENQQSSECLDEIQQKLLREKQQAVEDEMRETLKHREYDLQEKYELMFRDKQAEIMVRYDKEKKDYQKEMEQVLKHKVETVRSEKDQAFVKSLQRMRKDFDKKHRREMEKLRLKLLQEIAEGDGTEMEEEIREVVQKLNMENQELAEARDALLQQVNQLSHYRHEQLQQDINLSIGQHGVTTNDPSKPEPAQEEPLIQNRHQYRSQSLMLDWEFSPHSSFDYEGDGFDERLGDSDEDICLRPECQVLRHRLQVISEHLIEGFKPESSGSPESSCDFNSQEHGQGFKPEDDFLSASGNSEFVITPTTELESSFVREALRVEAESAKKRLESTRSVVDEVFINKVLSSTENIECNDVKNLEQEMTSSSPDTSVIKEGFISDSSNQNTPTNSPLRRSLSNQEDGFIAESDMSELEDIGKRFRDRMSSEEKKQQFIEDTKTRQNLSLSGDGFIAESDSENVFNIKKTDIKRSKSVPLAKIMISTTDQNIQMEDRPATAPNKVSSDENVWNTESSANSMADNLRNDSPMSLKTAGKISDVKISLSKGSNYAPGEEAINYLKTGDTHFIGEGFVSSEITKVKNELDNFSAVLKESDSTNKVTPDGEGSDNKNHFQSTEEENASLKQEKLKLENKVKDILKMYNKEKNELMDECNRIKIKLENESLCRQQLEQELLEFNEDFEKTGQDDDEENLGKDESRNLKSESRNKESSGFQMMQDIVNEKDKIISDYDKKLHLSFESLENSERKCDELEKLVGSLEEIVKDKEEEIKEMKEEMNKKVVDVSHDEYSVKHLEDLDESLNKLQTDRSARNEVPLYKRAELPENISEKFKKQVLTLQQELEKKNKLMEELSLDGDVETKILKQKIVEFEKLLADKDHYISKLEEELEHLTKMVNDQFDFVDYRAKMEQSFKEKEKYIKTLEEHFLKHDTFDSSPKSVGSANRTSPVRTSSPMQAVPISFQDSTIGRQEYKTPNTRNEFPDVDFWNFSTSSNVSAQRSLFRSTGSHYGSSDQRSLSSYSGSSGDQEQIRSGLGPDEDGHYALELKHFKLVDEISGLRRELRETKAIYNKENALLQEALEKEKRRKELNNSLSPKLETFSVDQTLQINELKQNISVLQESNRMLQIENNKWLKHIQEQECIVLELQAQTTSEVDDGRIEKIYGQQIKQLQNQRNDLMERMREIDTENTKLSFQLGEKAILEETLRREKDLLKAKLSEKEDIEKELRDKKAELEKQIKAQVKLEEILDHKNQVEKELMRQKRMLELELSEIECKLREKEELLQMQKDDLMKEMREKDSSRASSLCSSRSDLTSEASSFASSVLSTQSSPAHIGRLDSMLDRARKQHTYAVDSLKHILKSEQEPHDTRSRDRHRPSLSALKSQHFHKVPRK